MRKCRRQDSNYDTVIDLPWDWAVRHTHVTPL